MTAQPVTITVKYVNQPREAQWKSGSIKDANGQRFSVDKQFLEHFQVGETCDILWEQVGQYPTIVGKGGQLFPHAPQPAPGSAVQAGPPRNATWPAPAQNPPEMTHEKPAADTPPILSNVLAHAIAAGVITQPADLAEWAKWTNEAIKSFHAGVQQRSPGNAARNPEMTDIPLGDPNDPGPFPGDMQ